MFPTNRIVEIVQDATVTAVAEREAAEAVTRYLKADGERTQAALDGGAALNRLKKTTLHGGFGAVLKRLPISERTAQRWMRLDGANLKSATVALLGGLRKADEILAALGTAGLEAAPDLGRIAEEGVTDIIGVLRWAKREQDAAIKKMKAESADLRREGAFLRREIAERERQIQAARGRGGAA